MRDYAATISASASVFVVVWSLSLIMNVMSMSVQCSHSIGINTLSIESHKQRMHIRCVPPYQFVYTFHISIVSHIELMKWCIKLR